MPRLSAQDTALKQQKVSNLASSLVALLSCLPSLLLYKWLSCAEMNELLTSSNINCLDCLRAYCTQATKLGHLECRRFLKTKVRFYRLKGIESSRTLQEERGAHWSLPKLPRRSFPLEIFQDYVKAVNDFVSYNKEISKKRKAISPVDLSTPSKRHKVEVHPSPPSVTNPVSLLELACPIVALITPEKEKRKRRCHFKLVVVGLVPSGNPCSASL